MDEIEKIAKNLEWYIEKEMSYTDNGIDAEIYTTEFNEFFITIYPKILYDRKEKGYEYNIYNSITKDVFDSINYKLYFPTHPKSLSEAKVLSINKVMEIIQTNEIKLNRDMNKDFNKHMNILRNSIKNNDLNKFLKKTLATNKLTVYKLDLSNNPKEYILFICNDKNELKDIEYHYEINEFYRVNRLDPDNIDYINLSKVFKSIF
ncbi:MAG: hypothetical protein QXZ12_06865 [Thermoplasmata archaeon]